MAQKDWDADYVTEKYTDKKVGQPYHYSLGNHYRLVVQGREVTFLDNGDKIPKLGLQLQYAKFENGDKNRVTWGYTRFAISVAQLPALQNAVNHLVKKYGMPSLHFYCLSC